MSKDDETTPNNNGTVRVPQAGEIQRTDFSGTVSEMRAETASTALAAQAKAAVEAAYIMALRRPRDIDQVRVRLLKACRRPGFAETAMYSKPVGKEKNDDTGRWEDKFAEGLSIRFAEEAARNMGNLEMDGYAIYDDPSKKIMKFITIDLESNTKWARTVTVPKTKEVRSLRKGQRALGHRVNSYGDDVFIVEATPADVQKNEGAEASKAWRDQILKMVPSDIQEECKALVWATLDNKAAADPDGEKKKVLDSFATIGVEPVHLKEYLGHDLGTVSPAEVVSLRKIYQAIRDGQTTWGDVVEQRRETDEENGREGRTPNQPSSPTPQQPAAAGAQGTPVPAPAPAQKRNLSDVAAASRARRQGKVIDAESKPAPGQPLSGPDKAPEWAKEGEGEPAREPGADDGADK